MELCEPCLLLEWDVDVTVELSFNGIESRRWRGSPSKSLVFARSLVRVGSHTLVFTHSPPSALSPIDKPSAYFVSSSSRSSSAFVLFSLAHSSCLHEAPEHRTVAGYGRPTGATRSIHPSLSLVYPPPNNLLPAFSLDAVQAYFARLHLELLFGFVRLQETASSTLFKASSLVHASVPRNEPISPTSPFTLDVPDYRLPRQLLIATIRQSSSIFHFESSQQVEI
ncbi:hypothetical protein FBEOM_12399 [Fusarium beomiforme]|uniref:Uncharacterized protein n=1 Tax=Fusarium beomiforme TaxID=44412 RepID=A0A9P5A7T4_9HYPO|nr:hypothetical protein FBEOM_12399 [Fusarium beomiforme]